MNICVTTEQRFFRSKDGKVYSKISFPYKFWKRYLICFESVKVIARVKDVKKINEEWVRSDGPKVKFFAIKYYIGPIQYVINYSNIQKDLKRFIDVNDAIIFRVPSQIANTAIPILKKRNQSFSLEVVGDPWMSLSPGSIKHPLRPFLRLYFYLNLRKQCFMADCVSYVTQNTLQKKYPHNPQKYSTHYSSIYLSNDDFKKESIQKFSKKRLNIINVASMDTFYKGQDVLIKALKICVENDYDFYLNLVGDGININYYKKIVSKLKLHNYVSFSGKIKSGEKINEVLDKSDLFVLSSITEGLPRSLIEAMSRALPAIGSSVGGIPELLSSDFLVQPNDEKMLAKRIIKLFLNQELLVNASKSNLIKSKEFSNQSLKNRRNLFYLKVKENTRNI